MALAHTKAASVMEENIENISSHQVISLLMDGALERTNQAVMAFHANDEAELLVLLEKLVAIVNGLRNSLNMEAGGDVAENLNDLYLYIFDRLTTAVGNDLLEALDETKRIINEVKHGWDSIQAK